MITKLIGRLIIMSILSSVNLIAYEEVMGESFEINGLKGKYYENDGCIYLIGNFTKEEILIQQQNYKKRMAERTRQIELGTQRRYELKIETIKAQAMRDYLIAQGIPLREVADAVRKLKIRQNVVIGNITNTSSSKGGNVATSNNNTNTNNNKTEIDINVKK